MKAETTSASGSQKPVHSVREVECHDLQITEPAAISEPSYADWFRARILPARGLTMFLAFYIHWLLLLALSGVFLQTPSLLQPFRLNAVFDEDDVFDETLLTTVDTEFVIPETLTSKDTSLETFSELAAVASMSSLEQSSLDVLPDGLKALALSSAAAQVSEKKPARIGNAPKYAVTAGSFSVWTEPANPDPGEPYKIIIQIQLPDGTETYSVADLEGAVVGSDGYQKFIPGATRGFLPIENNSVKLEVPIVSADKNVQDTVFVRSKLLREAHRLQIMF